MTKKLSIINAYMTFDILKVSNSRDNQMKNIEYGNNFINGEVEVSSNSILQLTTSYSNGWKAYVDGEKVDIIKVNEGFIGIEIPKGKHNIKFKYETPYIKIATMLSTVGITIFILIFICEIKKGFEKRKKLLADTCRIYNENKS